MQVLRSCAEHQALWFMCSRTGKVWHYPVHPPSIGQTLGPRQRHTLVQVAQYFVSGTSRTRAQAFCCPPCPPLFSALPLNCCCGPRHMAGWGVEGKMESSRNQACLRSPNSQTTSGWNMTHTHSVEREEIFLHNNPQLPKYWSLSFPPPKMHNSWDLLFPASAAIFLGNKHRARRRPLSLASPKAFQRGEVGPGCTLNPLSDFGPVLCSLKWRENWPILWSPIDSIEKYEFTNSLGRPLQASLLQNWAMHPDSPPLSQPQQNSSIGSHVSTGWNLQETVRRD